MLSVSKLKWHSVWLKSHQSRHTVRDPWIQEMSKKNSTLSRANYCVSSFTRGGTIVSSVVTNIFKDWAWFQAPSQQSYFRCQVNTDGKWHQGRENTNHSWWSETSEWALDGRIIFFFVCVCVCQIFSNSTSIFGGLKPSSAAEPLFTSLNVSAPVSFRLPPERHLLLSVVMYHRPEQTPSILFPCEICWCFCNHWHVGNSG